MEKKKTIHQTTFKETPYPLQIVDNSIVYPLIVSKDQSEWQLKLICYDQNGQLIPFGCLADAIQFLTSDGNLCKVSIETVQKSKLKKLYKPKPVVNILSGKNKGKKNETTILQQAILLCNNKYEKMCHKKNNVSDIPHLMLLSTYKYKQTLTDSKAKKLKFPQYIQRKYDGLRCCCMTTQTEHQQVLQNIQDQEIKTKLYSRGHKEFTNLKHITEQTQLLLQNYHDKYKNYTLLLDGELYDPHSNLQEINGIIKNTKTDTQGVNYYIFDVDLISNGDESLSSQGQTDTKDDIAQQRQQIKLKFADRLEILKELQTIVNSLQLPNLILIDTYLAHDEEQVEKYLKEFLAEQYEGLVLRSPDSLYCYSLNNKRAADTLKYKPRLDMEVFVVGICDGIGKDTGAIVWNCQVDTQSHNSQSNKQFNVVQNIELEIRKQQFKYLQENSQQLEILMKIPYEIQYSALSNDGIPQQPRGLRFRLDQSNIQLSDDEFCELNKFNFF